jgi:hypothetical protein
MGYFYILAPTNNNGTMKKILLTFCLLQAIYVGAQNHKTYSGDYQLKGYKSYDGMNYSIEGGKATYTYIEEVTTGNHIKDGAFKYQLTLTGWTETINGYYKNGLKHGRWTHIIKKTDYPDESVYGQYQTLAITLTAKYNNGNPDSTWQLSYSEKNRKKVWVNLKEVWGKYSPEYIVKSSASFNNGKLAGNCSTIITEGAVKVIETKGTINKAGFLIGETKFLDRDEEDTYSFTDNYLVKITHRNPQTGQIKTVEDFTPYIKCVKEGSIDETLPPCIGDTARLSVMNGLLISDELFHFTGLGGDNTISYNPSTMKLVNNIEGGVYIKCYRQKIAPVAISRLVLEIKGLNDSLKLAAQLLGKEFTDDFFVKNNPDYNPRLISSNAPPKYITIPERAESRKRIMESKAKGSTYFDFVRDVFRRYEDLNAYDGENPPPYESVRIPRSLENEEIQILKQLNEKDGLTEIAHRLRMLNKISYDSLNSLRIMR